jgi:hypothetical protein
MEDKELCEWLREHSSGVYRNSEMGAIRIEELNSENEKLHKTVKQLWKEVDKQAKRCSASEDRLGGVLDKIRVAMDEL